MKGALAVGVAAAVVASPAAILRSEPFDIDADVRGVLTRYLRFTASELADLQKDHIVKHNLESRASGEFGVAGAARVHAAKAAFFAAARDIVKFKSDPGVLQIGRMSDPPTVEDLAPLTIDRTDFDPSSCRLHACGIRLPADMIQRLRQEIDVDDSTNQELAAAWLKRAIVADLTAYVAGNGVRYLQYDDDPTPVRPVDAFDAVLAHMPALGALAPALPDHLAKSPASRAAGAEDFFYWSKEKFGVAPFISVTQVTMLCPTPRTCVMTTRDVYSTRYIDASLAVAVASDAAGGDAFYLVYANRSQASALKGGLSGLKRSIVERRARSALEESLRTIKMRLESGR